MKKLIDIYDFRQYLNLIYFQHPATLFQPFKYGSYCEFMLK